MARPPTTLFEDAIDAPIWLEADQLTPYAERSKRDRDIARSLRSRNRVRRIRDWWRTVAPSASEGTGARFDRIRAVITLAMMGLGAIAGASVALAAFHYDGSQPVNVVRLIALLVGVQLVLLLLTLLLIPGRVIVLGRIQDTLAAINPGAVAVSVFRRLAQAPPDLARIFDWHAARVSAGRFAKWQLLYWSQVSAVTFNVAALATAIALVTFTDLAFGWSTTLDTDAATVSRIVQGIAWPWHAMAPTAVPSTALVEQSQFFRLADGNGLTDGSSRALGGWWPFTVLAIVTYGLLPRLVLLGLAALRLQAATTALLVDDPRVTALLDRMASPDVETAAAEHDETESAGTAPTAAAKRNATGAAHAVVWEASLKPAAAEAFARRRLGLEVAAVVEAGGSRALGADQRALEQIAAWNLRTLVVFTPAWEPPLLELLDFLAEARRRIGTAAPIVVTPVAEGDGDVTPVERDTWVRAIGRLRDPQLYVETGAA